MRLSTLITAAFAGVTFAAPIIAGLQDLPTVNNAIGNVQKAVDSLAGGIEAINDKSDPKTEVPKLVGLSKGVLDAIGAGTTAIKGTQELSLVEATGLLSTAQALAKKVQAVVDDLIKKKPIIDSVGEAKTVLTSLNDQKKATQDFIAAIVSKVPSLAKNIAQTQAGQVITILDKGIKAYGG